MKIGILIPTFNRKQHLAQAIDSVLFQTHKDIELIVIDDTSTDGTRQLVTGYTDPRIRYIYNTSNAGLIENINKGVPMFSNDVLWCMVLCDDDYLEKDCINKLATQLIDNVAKSIIHAHLVFVNNQGNKIRDALPAPPAESALEYIHMRSRSLRETYLTGILFNREVFYGINGYPNFLTGLAADDAFIFALALKDRLVFEQNATAYVRIHEGAESVIGSDGTKKIKTVLQFGEYCKSFVNKTYAFNSEQIKQFENVLYIYLRNLGTMLWIRSAHYESSSPNYNYNKLSELISLVQDYPDIFTFRVKLALACHKTFGIFLEGYKWYRSLWNHYISMTNFFTRITKL